MPLDVETSQFVKLSGFSPARAPVGEYHICFSLDGHFFVPMVLNNFVSFASAASESSYTPKPFAPSVATFFIYSMSITGQSLFSGPSFGPSYDIIITGENFPLMSELRPYAPAIRVYFGDNMRMQLTDNAAEGVVKIDSSSQMRIRVPSIGALGVNETKRNASIYISLDNYVLLPPGGLPFSFFPPPIMGTWFPLYGLFETETTVTISGQGFTDTGEARCRYVAPRAQAGTSAFTGRLVTHHALPLILMLTCAWRPT